MIELLYDAIRVAPSESGTTITAIFKDSNGSKITTGDIYFNIAETGTKIKGRYKNGAWEFELNKMPKGRYMYFFSFGAEPLNFSAPIYFE